MRGLRLFFSTVITISSREVWDASMSLSLLVLMRKATQVISDALSAQFSPSPSPNN